MMRFPLCFGRAAALLLACSCAAGELQADLFSVDLENTFGPHAMSGPEAAATAANPAFGAANVWNQLALPEISPPVPIRPSATW